jgi:hypothetical protein
MKRHGPAALGLRTLVALAYTPVWAAGLVWDDDLFVFGNPPSAWLAA